MPMCLPIRAQAPIAPTKPKPRVGAPSRTAPTEPDKGIPPNVVIKPTSDIAKEMEEYFAQDNYLLILYNDNFNKRAYVASALAEILGFDQQMADAVMLTAHNYGFAVVGEWYKELCEEYAKKLNDKGILAEARKASGDAAE
jgi:ATP-dependent Clp protease adapter protein ClpS